MSRLVNATINNCYDGRSFLLGDRVFSATEPRRAKSFCLQSHCNDFRREFQFRGSATDRPSRPVELLSNCRNIL